MAQINVNQRYRIRRSAEHEKAMKHLIAMKLFQTYGQIMVVSAIIGYKNNAFDDHFQAANDPVLMNQFNSKAYDIINFLAFAKEKKQSILKDYDQDEEREGLDIYAKYHIFEGYANGGFPILLDKLGIDINNLEEFDQIELLRKYYRLLVCNDF